MQAKVFAQFEFLRAHVESTMERPSVVMVTSAKPRDGKSFTAFGLAERLADAGRRVVLLDYNEGDDAAAARTRPNELSRRRSFPIVSLPIDRDGTGAASPALRHSIDEFRGTYDYTIVDAAPMLDSRIAILLASIVDGILVTVRLGRTSDTDDAALVASLQRADASVLGVVAVAANDIEAFGARFESRSYNDALMPLLPPAPLDHATMPAFEGRRR